MSLYVGQIVMRKGSNPREYFVYAGDALFDANGVKRTDIDYTHCHQTGDHYNDNHTNHVRLNKDSESLWFGNGKPTADFINDTAEAILKQREYDICGDSYTCDRCKARGAWLRNHFYDQMRQILGVGNKYSNLKPDSVHSLLYYMQNLSKDCDRDDYRRYGITGDFTWKNHPAMILLTQYLNKAMDLPYDKGMISRSKKYLKELVSDSTQTLDTEYQ